MSQKTPSSQSLSEPGSGQKGPPEKDSLGQSIIRTGVLVSQMMEKDFQEVPDS